MRTAYLPLLVLSLVAGCAAAESSASSSSNLDEATDGGADGGADAAAPAAPLAVTPYAQSDASLASPKARWSLDGQPVGESLQTQFEAVNGSVARRFRLAAAFAPKTGLQLEFGHGADLVMPGVYDCKTLDAVVALVLPDGSEPLTVIGNTGTQRSCTVTVDTAVEQLARPNAVTRSSKLVTGHFDAEVGPRDDGSVISHRVSGAFAGGLVDLVAQ